MLDPSQTCLCISERRGLELQRDPSTASSLLHPQEGTRDWAAKGDNIVPGKGPLETLILSSPSPSALETPGSDQPKALPSGRGKGHHTPPQSHLTIPISPHPRTSATSPAAPCPPSQEAELGSFLTPFSTLCFMSRTFLH